MKTALVVLLAAQALSAGDMRTIADFSGPRVLYRCLIGKTDKQEFGRMATDFLQPQDVTVGVLSAYGSESQYTVAGPIPSESGSYDDTRRLLNRYNIDRSGCPEVQQAVKFGAGLLLRWMDRDCRSGERLLYGKTSPLEMELGGIRVEILEFSFEPPMLGEGNEHKIHVSFFVRTSGPASEEYARAVTAQITTLTGIRNLSVGLRSDEWFFNFGGFPALYPFEGRPQFPSIEQFLRTREAHCSMFGEEPILCLERRGVALQQASGPGK